MLAILSDETSPYAPLMQTEVHTADYAEWPNLFSAEAQRIISALPAEVAVEHIGSTA